MKLYRTFNENLLNLNSSCIEVKGAEFFHLSKSLRIKVDDEVEVFDGKGSSCKAIVKELHKSYLILYLSSAINTETNKSSIISIIPFIKKENLNFLSHKLTELGVDEIHLYKPDLLDQSLQKKDLNKIMDKIDAILINACKQCERNFKPKIFMHNNLSMALKINKDRTLIAFNFSGKTNLNTNMKDNKIGIITGPESGFSENEEIIIKNKSNEAYLLGDFPLKAETAAIVAVSLIQHQKGLL